MVTVSKMHPTTPTVVTRNTLTFLFSDMEEVFSDYTISIASELGTGVFRYKGITYPIYDNLHITGKKKHLPEEYHIEFDNRLEMRNNVLEQKRKIQFFLTFITASVKDMWTLIKVIPNKFHEPSGLLNMDRYPFEPTNVAWTEEQISTFKEVNSEMYEALEYASLMRILVV